MLIADRRDSKGNAEQSQLEKYNSVKNDKVRLQLFSKIAVRDRGARSKKEILSFINGFVGIIEDQAKLHSSDAA